MKKTLYTLCVDNYAPEITKHTFPLMKQWASKIGADFFVISERKFPAFPVVYEKFQIYELSKQHENDWSIYLDADTLIHPDFWDITSLLTKDTTCSGYTSDFSLQRFKPDNFFLRDGRYIGKGNWCMIASDWCRDIWRPLEDLTWEEAVKNITPTQNELNNGIKPDHLIDDYLISRNIAKFGLKHSLITEIERSRNIPGGYLWHTYVKPEGWENAVLPNGTKVFSPEEISAVIKEKGKPSKDFTINELKVVLLKKQLQVWGVNG